MKMFYNTVLLQTFGVEHFSTCSLRVGRYLPKYNEGNILLHDDFYWRTKLLTRLTATLVSRPKMISPEK